MTSKIDSAIKRLFILLLFADLVVLLKLIFNGCMASQMIAGIISIVALCAFIYSVFNKTISMGMIEDSELDLEFQLQYKLHWWNFYKHPLTAKARPQVDAVHAEHCKI